MAELPRYPGTDDEEAEADHGSEPGAPRRARVVGTALVVALVLLFVVLHLSGVLGPGSH